MHQMWHTWLQVRQEMASMRGQYEQQVTLLHDKLHWYAENQQLLTDKEVLVKQQAAVIAKLQNRLGEGGGEGSQQRAADLQKQVLNCLPATALFATAPLATHCLTLMYPKFMPLQWHVRRECSSVLRGADDAVMTLCLCLSQSKERMSAVYCTFMSGQSVKVRELKDALAGKKQGMVATLVREAAEPMHEQETELRELRDEVERQRQRADNVCPARCDVQCVAT
jgi:hypothetical protein